MTPHTYELQHPLHQVPAVAVQAGHYRQNGRNIGLELQFCDGHRASLTYDEIEELQRAAQPTAVITISRHSFDYFQTLIRDGDVVMDNARIGRDRALEIVTEHTAGQDMPDLDPTRPLTWSWSVEVVD